MSDVEPLVDLAGAAEFLSMTEKQVRKLIERAPGNGFPVRHAGRLLRFKLSELDAWTCGETKEEQASPVAPVLAIAPPPRARHEAPGTPQRAPRGSIKALYA